MPNFDALNVLRKGMAILKLNDKEGDDKNKNVPKGFEKFFKKKEEENKQPDQNKKDEKETKKEE
jgi:hypothetical protein